jgi:hypothetical protein
MGIFQKMETTPNEKVMKEIESLLVEGEYVTHIYSLVLDYAALTKMRLIFVEKDGTETVINSISFSKITGISLSKGGMLSFAKNVYVYASGGVKHKITFLSGENALSFYKAVTEMTL